MLVVYPRESWLERIDSVAAVDPRNHASMLLRPQVLAAGSSEPAVHTLHSTAAVRDKAAVRLEGWGCTCSDTWLLVAVGRCVGWWGSQDSCACLRMQLVALVALGRLAVVAVVAVLVVLTSPLLAAVAARQGRASDWKTSGSFVVEMGR